MIDGLLPQHAALLAASAITDAVAEARGYRSVTVKAELTRLGFSDRQARVPALLIPVWGVGGEIVTYQARPDEPRIDTRARAIKYETPAGSRMVVDVHPSIRARLGDPNVPLFITEGPRKGDAAVSAGLCCVALLGVWNWRGTNEHAGKVALADFEAIALNGRKVHVTFDSDAATKPEVGLALARLSDFLASRGARVRIVRLPAGPGGTKTGLDDYLAAGHSVDDLLALAADAEPATVPYAVAGAPYQSGPDGLVRLRMTLDGPIEQPLTNFDARIVADVLEDDGAERHRLFEIEAELHERHLSVRVPAAAFAPMTWVAEHLGAGAVVLPRCADDARAAIQLLSGSPPERSVYAHLGWRDVDGTPVYLHAAGAIGPDGPVEGIEVQLAEPLDRHRLPDPPSGDEFAVAIRASLGLLEVAPDRISVPLLGATYRAAPGASDFSVHFVGPTGVGKTEIASLAQAHHGRSMDARHVPGSWSSTANTNEDLAFRAKDALFLVDDFTPAGSRIEVGRTHRDADRLLRAQGNRAARGRMRADTTLRPPRPPRGLILSTGEDVPQGQSLRARMIVIAVEAADVNWLVLTRCQAEAAAGRYDGAMAAFVSWLAAQGEAGIARRRHALVHDGAQPIAHRRIPRNLEGLAAGFAALLEFATEMGAIDAARHAALWKRGYAALASLGTAQAADQTAVDPVQRFLEYLVSALTSGRAHVANPDGEPPAEPRSWGWRREVRAGELGPGPWRPQGTRVGWLDGDDLYLEPTASYAAVRTAGESVGEPIGLTSRTLHERLHQANRLVNVDEGRERLTVRKMLEGRRRAVLHLAASSVSEPAQPSHLNGTWNTDGPVGWAGSSHEETATGPRQGPEPAHRERGSPADGPDGTDGPVGGGRDTRDLVDDAPTGAVADSDADLIELVRQRLAAGHLDGSPIQLTSGVRVVDPSLAASRWLSDLGQPGWVGDVARVHLVRLGRALFGAASDA